MREWSLNRRTITIEVLKMVAAAKDCRFLETLFIGAPLALLEIARISLPRAVELAIRGKSRGFFGRNFPFRRKFWQIYVASADTALWTKSLGAQGKGNFRLVEIIDAGRRFIGAMRIIPEEKRKRLLSLPFSRAQEAKTIDNGVKERIEGLTRNHPHLASFLGLIEDRKR